MRQAIVTDIEGTTRDVLREHISATWNSDQGERHGGLRESENPVEREGIRRAWESIAQADVVIYLVDASKGLCDADRRIVEELTHSRLQPARLQLVYSKSDLLLSAHEIDSSALYLSAKTGSGMDLLIDRITGQVVDLNQDNHAFMARRRHVDALHRALQCLQQAASGFEISRAGELAAEDLRAAQQNLNEITGEFSSEDLLGKIFSSFCIGK